MKTKSSLCGRFEFAGNLLAVILLLGSAAVTAAAEPKFPLKVGGRI